MSFKNFLDLRRKPPQQTQIIERIILQKRSWKSDLSLTLSVILIASAIIWGISKAETLINPPEISPSQATSFSIMGTVTELTTTTIGIDTNANKEVNGTLQTFDKQNLGGQATTDSFNTTSISSIQTNHFSNISLSDIKTGDNIILQGVKRGDSIQIFKIFSYGNEVATGILTEEANTIATTTELIVATSTATSTDDTATSTIDVSVIPAEAGIQSENGGVETASSTSSSTPTIVDIVKDTVSNIIDALDGTNATSSDPIINNQTETPQTPPADISEIFEGYTNPLGNIIPKETLSTPTPPEVPPTPILDTNQPTN